MECIPDWTSLYITLLRAIASRLPNLPSNLYAQLRRLNTLTTNAVNTHVRDSVNGMALDIVTLRGEFDITPKGDSRIASLAGYDFRLTHDTLWHKK